jgi:hypothetical protein
MVLGSPFVHVYVAPLLLPELLPLLLDELPLPLLPDPLPLLLDPLLLVDPLLLDDPLLLEDPLPELVPPLDDDPLLLPPELLPFSGPLPALEGLLGSPHAAVRATRNGTTQTRACAIVHSLRRIAMGPEPSARASGSVLYRTREACKTAHGVAGPGRRSPTERVAWPDQAAKVLPSMTKRYRTSPLSMRS